jgi:ABC-type dipeptide/oligopeptide/nickel transport system ATPase component
VAIAQKSLLSHQLEDIENKIKKYQRNMPTIEELEDQLKNSIITKKILEDKIEVSKKTAIAVDRHQELLRKCDEIDEIKQRLFDLQEFKLLCKEAECASLTQLVKSLNIFINSVANKLFDDPIRINISLFHTLKKKVKGVAVEKPKARLNIHYKGGEFTDAKQLSGGECERISLILSLAFNHVVGSNLLILDEATGSLEGERKDDCFNTIKECMSGKTIIMTNHEGHVGYYDNIVELKL